MGEAQRTAADVMLEALHQGGVEFIFANFGTDHAGLIEAYHRHQAPGSAPLPRLLLCQHEEVAIHAAIGYAHFTGRAQGVFVHVDVGTSNLGAGLHNAARAHLPVLIFAGVAPWTELGERRGSRDFAVHWQQDVYDQGSIVREYIKWEYEIRAGCNIHYAVARGLQMTNAEPQGPVYLMAAREPLEEPALPGLDYPVMATPQRSVPDEPVLDKLVQLLRSARRPLVLTSDAGRTPGAVEALATFAETYVLPVAEIRPWRMNFPADHPLHQGYNPKDLLEKADLVLAIECDVPWIPVQSRPRPDATIVWISEDPLGSQMPMRGFPGHLVLQGNALATLTALTRRAEANPAPDPQLLTARRRELATLHDAQRAQWRAAGNRGGGLTAANVARLVADIGGDEAIILNEAVMSAPAVFQQLGRRIPNTFMSNAGCGLGQALPGALGAKLARPDADVIAIVGDGTYVFGLPTATHWSAQAYGAPFLTVIMNNSRWDAVADATRKLYPTGLAASAGVPLARFPKPPALSRVVTAVDGVGYEVRTVDETERAIREGLQLVRQGTSVVIDAKLTE